MKLDILPSIKSFYDNARHILHVSYKPTMEHFQKTLRIVLLGTLIVGVMGYVIYLLISLVA